eukprot:scaffold35959_cov73-Skeletonema_marinoi.AAC.1
MQCGCPDILRACQVSRIEANPNPRCHCWFIMMSMRSRSIASGQVLSSVPYFLGDLIYAHKIMEPFKAKAMIQKDTLHLMLMCQIATPKSAYDSPNITSHPNTECQPY